LPLAAVWNKPPVKVAPVIVLPERFPVKVPEAPLILPENVPPAAERFPAKVPPAADKFPEKVPVAALRAPLNVAAESVNENPGPVREPPLVMFTFPVTFKPPVFTVMADRLPTFKLLMYGVFHTVLPVAGS
jgi:hypothetical protein